MKVVDVFSGLGGLTAGCVEAAYILNRDLDISFACDISKPCADVYRHNFRDYINKYHEGSILEFNEDIVKDFSEVDYFFAGPPCQGHSDLNNASRRSDPRNLLYLESIRIIRRFLPETFVIENVPTVVHAKEKVVLELKSELGHSYNISEYLVDFSRLGIAQTRKRHILIGSKYSLPDDFFESIYDKYIPVTLRDVIYDLRDKKSNDAMDTPSKMSVENDLRARYLLDHDLYDLPNELRPKCHQKKHSYKSMYGRLHWDKPAQTITGGFGSMGQGRFLHPSLPRVITPREAARIQGIPDWFDFSIVKKRGDIQKMIGNAVPPVLSKELIIKIEGMK